MRLVVSNARYQDLLALPDWMVEPGIPLSEMTRFGAERGDYGPGDPAELAARRLADLTERQSTLTKRRNSKGQILEFHSRRLPDGGLVISFTDVTARVAAEAELERINHSLEARVEERTAALTRVNAELEQARTKADAANRDKTRFLAAASHDLLQPLNAARLYTATLLERAGGTRARRPRALDRGLAQRGRGDHVGAPRHLAHRLRRAQAAPGAVRDARPAQEDRGRVRAAGAGEVDHA